MLILIDARADDAAKETLRSFGKVVEFITQDIVYPAISGHPDLFFCQAGKEVIAAPNTPKFYLKTLENEGIVCRPGYSNVGAEYPWTAGYNCVISDNVLIHRGDITDRAILDFWGSGKIIDVQQGYTRCNLLPVGGGRFITSDRGIEKSLNVAGFDVLYISPEGVALDGFPHGFIGGAMGRYGNRVFIAGSPESIPEGETLRRFILDAGNELCEINGGAIRDLGGILFLE
ncbi:MAG: hypothetical protein A2014_01255 [Spirochaetes bacterium GWF1_49_6]|nr:MAG: hypothetical protein A2014_01255 [Spirochaetes bacterium GWF1_49_6]